MKQRRFVPLFLLLLALAGCTRIQPAPSDTSGVTEPKADSATTIASHATSASNFDFYLLNLSWSPEYCESHPTATECAQHAAFVLHGLWPERSDGTYPQNCSNAPGPSDPSKYADIYPDPGLLNHEWRTHGTCSDLSPDAFFTDARTAYKSISIPKKLSRLSSPISLSPSEIAAQFQQSNPGLSASSIVISCGNNYLTAVEVCLDKNLKATSCGAVRSCRANTVRIPNP